MKKGNLDAAPLFHFITGYAKEIFEMLFDSFMEVHLSPDPAKDTILIRISQFDDSKQWLHTILKEFEKLGEKKAATMLEQCGRACVKSHGLIELSNEVRREVEDPNDLDSLFRLYMEKVYNNSPQLYKEGDIIYLEYLSCGCPIVKNKEINNPHFCNCTVGYTKERFESLFNRPVQVELLESILGGNEKCRQAITVLDND